MFKSLKMLLTPYTLYHLYISPIAAVLLLLPIIFIKSGAAINMLGLIALFEMFMTAAMLMTVFPIVGSTPAEPKTMKWAANNRTMMNGSPSSYDLACILPTTRKKLFTSFFKVWLPVILIMQAEITAAAVFNYTEGSKGVISAISVCFALMVAAVPNIYYYKPKNNFFALFLLIIVYILPMIFLMVTTIMEITISAALPPAAAVIIPIAAMIYCILFFAKTALLGDFARNGEKVD